MPARSPIGCAPPPGGGVVPRRGCLRPDAGGGHGLDKQRMTCRHHGQRLSELLPAEGVRSLNPLLENGAVAVLRARVEAT